MCSNVIFILADLVLDYLQKPIARTAQLEFFKTYIERNRIYKILIKLEPVINSSVRCYHILLPDILHTYYLVGQFPNKKS